MPGASREPNVNQQSPSIVRKIIMMLGVGHLRILQNAPPHSRKQTLVETWHLHFGFLS